MYMRIVVNKGWNPEQPYGLKIGTTPMDQRDDGVFTSLVFSENQLIGLRDGINEFLRIKDYIPNTGSAFQQELDK